MGLVMATVIQMSLLLCCGGDDVVVNSASTADDGKGGDVEIDDADIPAASCNVSFSVVTFCDDL